MTDHEDDFPTIPPAPLLPGARVERSSTEPASGPVSPELKAIRAGFFNLDLKLDSFDKRIQALEAGVRMAILGNEADREKLGKIAAELQLLRESQEAQTAAVGQIASGLRHAVDDLRERVEEIEHPGNGLSAEG